MSYQPWNHTEETYMHIAKWKELIWKGYMLYDANSMTSGKGKTMETVKKKSQTNPYIKKKLNMI